MANTGAWPVDPTTPVGLFRQQLGDVNGTPAEPPVDPQTAEFEFISDAAIAALITAYAGMPDMAMAKAMQSMANQLILQAQDIQVDDIKIKTIERARLMLEASATLAGSASAENASTGFDVIALSTRRQNRYPQGQPYPIGF